MEYDNVIKISNLNKKFRNFKLDIPSLEIPKGFSTALIGENGAGKSTLMNILAGIRNDYKGDIEYFGRYNDKERESNPAVKNAMGYTGTQNYYFSGWTVQQVEEISKLLFEGFDDSRFRRMCEDLAVFPNNGFEGNKKISSLSDGMRTKLMLAGVLARDTDLLILDEPASPLDPLMRDKLCEILRDYLGEKDGRSVFFSTHNISDMESVTDYCIILEHGMVAEQGFVEELKEKYILVKGECEDADRAKEILYTISTGKYGFEGICLAKDIDRLAGMDVITESPSLFQISVAVMKKSSQVK